MNLAVPLAVALAAVLSVALLQRRANPSVAAVTLTVSALGVAVALQSALVLYGTALVAGSAVPGWCSMLLGHQVQSHPALGGALLVLAAVLGWRGVRQWRRRRAELAATRPAPDAPVVVVLDDAEPFAYAHPAAGGRVVLSSGLLDRLDAREQAVVVAHECAHIDRRHHWFLAAAEVSAAVVPLLAGVPRAVRLATERWADEVAARRVGDRALVARTIARTALARPTTAVAGFGGATVRRVEALLQHPDTRSHRGDLALIAATVTVAVAAGLQLHHAGEAIAHVVPHLL